MAPWAWSRSHQHVQDTECPGPCHSAGPRLPPPQAGGTEESMFPGPEAQGHAAERGRSDRSFSGTPRGAVRGRGTPHLPGSPLSQTRAQRDKAVGSGTHCLWGQACLRAEHRRPRPRPRQGVQQTCGAGSARTRRAVVRGPLPGPGFPASPLGKHWPKVAPLSSVFFGAETSTQGAGGPGRLRPPGPPSCVRTQLSSGPRCPLLSSPLPGSPGSPRPDWSPGRKSAAVLRPAWQLTSRL